MAFGLSPLVKGSGVKGKALILVFTASLIGIATAVGAVLGLAGAPVAERIEALPVLVGVAVLGLLIELRVVPVKPPYRHWQVPRNWPRKYGPVMGYALWGATLGLGVVSYVPFVTYHVLLVCLFLSGGPVAGAALAALYGVGRALASLIPAVAAARNPGESRDRASAALDREGLHRGLQLASLFAFVVVMGMGASFGLGG